MGIVFGPVGFSDQTGFGDSPIVGRAAGGCSATLPGEFRRRPRDGRVSVCHDEAARLLRSLARVRPEPSPGRRAQVRLSAAPRADLLPGSARWRRHGHRFGPRHFVATRSISPDGAARILPTGNTTGNRPISRDTAESGQSRTQLGLAPAGAPRSALSGNTAEPAERRRSSAAHGGNARRPPAGRSCDCRARVCATARRRQPGIKYDVLPTPTTAATSSGRATVPNARGWRPIAPAAE